MKHGFIGRAPNIPELAKRVAIPPEFLANVRGAHHSGHHACAHRCASEPADAQRSRFQHPNNRLIGKSEVCPG